MHKNHTHITRKITHRISSSSSSTMYVASTRMGKREKSESARKRVISSVLFAASLAGGFQRGADSLKREQRGAELKFPRLGLAKAGWIGVLDRVQ